MYYETTCITEGTSALVQTEIKYSKGSSMFRSVLEYVLVSPICSVSVLFHTSVLFNISVITGYVLKLCGVLHVP